MKIALRSSRGKKLIVRIFNWHLLRARNAAAEMSSLGIDAHKPRVFVSSVIQGFEPFRLAAKSGIIAGGGEPVLVEDYPSISSSPRNACLDGVLSCDALAIIIGERGGWVTPSGKLVVEEELEEAEKVGRLVFVFIQDTARDKSAQELVKRLSAYASGYFRTTFASPDSLAEQVRKTVQTIPREGGDTAVEDFASLFADMPRLGDECSLRFAITTTRYEQVVDPVMLDSVAFKGRLMDIGHRGDVGLFSYEVGKSTDVGATIIVINQDDDRRRGTVDFARLEIGSRGAITIDTNVTTRVQAEEPYSTQSRFEIVEEDISDRLRACFSFCRLYWEQTDPYVRHQQFVFNVALNNVGHRRIVKDRRVRRRFSLGFEEQQSVLAFGEGRRCNRQGLAEPKAHIDAVLEMLRRQLGPPESRGPLWT